MLLWINMKRSKIAESLLCVFLSDQVAGAHIFRHSGTNPYAWPYAWPFKRGIFLLGRRVKILTLKRTIPATPISFNKLVEASLVCTQVSMDAAYFRSQWCQNREVQSNYSCNYVFCDEPHNHYLPRMKVIDLGPLRGPKT